MPSEIRLELVSARAAPLERPFDEGITISEGRTLPFLVERQWSGPAGNYWETWSIRRGGREILYASKPQLIRTSGMQSVREFVDRVTEPIEIDPGKYHLVFVIEGLFMGSTEIEVTSSDEAAA